MAADLVYTLTKKSLAIEVDWTLRGFKFKFRVCTADYIDFLARQVCGRKGFCWHCEFYAYLWALSYIRWIPFVWTWSLTRKSKIEATRVRVTIDSRFLMIEQIRTPTRPANTDSHSQFWGTHENFTHCSHWKLKFHYTAMPDDIFISSIGAEWHWLATTWKVWDTGHTLLHRSQTWNLRSGFMMIIVAAKGTTRTWRQNSHKLEAIQEQWNCKYNPERRIVRLVKKCKY